MAVTAAVVVAVLREPVSGSDPADPRSFPSWCWSCLWSQRDWAAIQSADVTNDGQSLRLKHPWAGYEQLLPRTPPPVAPVPFDWSTVPQH